MVSWKGAAALLVILAAVVVYAWATRPQPAKEAARLFPCDEPSMVGVVAQTPSGLVVEISRSAPGEQWQVVRPVQGAADQVAAQTLAQDLHSIVPDSHVENPGALSQYGLDTPRETVTCRVKDGSSYTLTVGKETFDGGEYYALKGGDPRVYVISSVPVDDIDRNLKDPPVRTGAS